jgi:hypothetical protein
MKKSIVFTLIAISLFSCVRFNADIFKKEIETYDFKFISAEYSDGVFKATLQSNIDTTGGASPFATAIIISDRLVGVLYDFEPKKIVLSVVLKGISTPYIVSCDFHKPVSYTVEQNGTTIWPKIVKVESKPTTPYVSPTDKLKKLMAEEPSVKDFVLTEAKVLYISVISDGTRRDGLASYFCQQMKDNGISVDQVKIIKFGSQNHPDRDNAYGILLGESWCK